MIATQRMPWTVARVEKVIHRFRDRFRVLLADFPKGIENRKKIYRAACDESRERERLPHHRARDAKICNLLKRARRSESARKAARRRAEDPACQLRQRVLATLRRLGFARECATSGASAYYQHREHDVCVRISDHSVPMTAERFNDQLEGHFTWAGGMGNEIIIEEGSSAEAMNAARELVSVRRQIRRCRNRRRRRGLWIGARRR